MGKYTTRTSTSTQQGHQQAHNKDISKHSTKTSANIQQGHQQVLNKDISKHTTRTSASTQQGHQQVLNKDISKHTARSRAITHKLSVIHVVPGNRYRHTNGGHTCCFTLPVHITLMQCRNESILINYLIKR